MRLGMFTTKEAYATWLKGEIEAVRNNGLKQAQEMYETALRGEGKEKWMSFNNTTSEEVWNNHLCWLREQVEYLKKRIRKYEKELANQH